MTAGTVTLRRYCACGLAIEATSDPQTTKAVLDALEATHQQSPGPHKRTTPQRAALARRRQARALALAREQDAERR